MAESEVSMLDLSDVSGSSRRFELRGRAAMKKRSPYNPSGSIEQSHIMPMLQRKG